MAEHGSEYLALARKYRPQNFEDVVGQEHVLNALAHSIDAQRTHHAYLLTGTRGIGKTTIARIFAKALECKEGMSSHPCGECDACKGIAAGAFPDVIEIDAASQTKVDDTRVMLENIQYPPINARYKIYIIDEVHMLTTNSFNALLKTLEEPPAYAKFILATTDPHKIPTTVLSRCLQFQLRALNLEEIEGQLRKICEKENISVENEAVLAIARAARGSMRDALSLCDQAIALGHGTLDSATVYSMLGTVGDVLINDIFELLAGKASVEGEAIDLSADFANLLDKIRQKAPNYKSLLDELVIAFHDVAMYQLIGGTKLEVFSFNTKTLETYARRLTPAQVQLYYQIVLEGIQEYQYAADGRSAFEMTLLRLMAFTPEKKKVGKPWLGETNAVEVDFISELVREVKRTTSLVSRQRLGVDGSLVSPSQSAIPKGTGMDSAQLLELQSLRPGTKTISIEQTLHADGIEAMPQPKQSYEPLCKSLSDSDLNHILSLVDSADPARASAEVSKLCQSLGLEAEQSAEILNLVATLTQAQNSVSAARVSLEQTQAQIRSQEKQVRDKLHSIHAMNQELDQYEQSVADQAQVPSPSPMPSLAPAQAPAPMPAQAPTPAMQPQYYGQIPSQVQAQDPYYNNPNFQVVPQRIQNPAYIGTAAYPQNPNYAYPRQSPVYGAGPQGAIGQGYTLPSPQERAIAAAAQARQAYMPAAVPKQQQVAQDFMKKVDPTKVDQYAHIEQVHQTHAVSLDGIMRTEEGQYYVSDYEEVRQREQIQHEHYAKASIAAGEFITEVRTRIKEEKKKSQPRSDNTTKVSINRLEGAISQIKSNKRQLDEGATLAEQEHGEFSLSQQGAYGYDVNDDRHLGSQLVGSISLEKQEDGMAIVQSPIASEVKPSTPEEPEFPVDVVIEPNLSGGATDTSALRDPIAQGEKAGDSIVDSSLSLNQNAPQQDSFAMQAAAPVQVHEQPNLALNSMISAMQQSEGLSSDSVSIDDIMGSSFSSEQASVDFGAETTSPEDAEKKLQELSLLASQDLPPWEEPLAQAGTISADGSGGTMSRRGVNDVGANGGVVVAEAGTSLGSISIKSNQQDQAIINAAGPKLRTDGTIENADLSKTISQFHQSMQGQAKTLQEQAKRSAASMEVLDSFGNNYEQRLKIEESIPDSPWDLQAKCAELKIGEGRTIKLYEPNFKADPLQSKDNYAVSISEDEDSRARSKKIDLDHWFKAGRILKVSFNSYWGEKLDESDLRALLQREGKEYEEFCNQEIATRRAFKNQTNQSDESLYAWSDSYYSILAQRDSSINAKPTNITTDTNQPVIPAASVDSVVQANPVAQAAPIPPMAPMAMVGGVAPNASVDHTGQAAQAAPIPPMAPMAMVGGVAPNASVDPTGQAAQATPISPMAPMAMVGGVAPARNVDLATDSVDYERPDYIVQSDELYGSDGSYAESVSADFIPESFDEDADSSVPVMGDRELSFSDNSLASDSKPAQSVVPYGSVEFPGLRRLNQDDFLQEVAKEDEWYQFLLRCYPDKGPMYATLTTMERQINLNNANKWTLFVPNNQDVLFIAKNFWSEVQKRFDDCLGYHVEIETQNVPNTPLGSPIVKAQRVELERVELCRKEASKLKSLANLLNLAREDLSNVRIELYTTLH